MFAYVKFWWFPAKLGKEIVAEIYREL